MIEVAVSEKGDLVEKKTGGMLRWAAQFFSYCFHPIFIPLYATWFLVFIHPSLFVGYSTEGKIWMLVRVGYTMVFFPLITVLLLRALGFISSFYLETQRDRIIPYIASGIFFFWAYLVFRNQPEIPGVLTAFTFGVFLSSSAALMANIYIKISMHAIGMGGLTGLLILMSFNDSMLMTVPISIGVLMTGVVCTSRLLVSNHKTMEIYSGLLLGFCCQLIGLFLYG